MATVNQLYEILNSGKFKVLRVKGENPSYWLLSVRGFEIAHASLSYCVDKTYEFLFKGLSNESKSNEENSE